MSEDIQENPSQESLEPVRADELYRMVSSLSASLCGLENAALAQMRKAEQEARREAELLHHLISRHLPVYDQRLAAIVLEEPTSFLARHDIPGIKEKIAENDREEAAYREEKKISSIEEIRERVEVARREVEKTCFLKQETWLTLRTYKIKNAVLDSVSRFNAQKENKGRLITKKNLRGLYAPVQGIKGWVGHLVRYVSDSPYRTARGLLKRHKIDAPALLSVLAEHERLTLINRKAEKDADAARSRLWRDEPTLRKLGDFASRRGELQSLLAPEGLFCLLHNSVAQLIGREGYGERLMEEWSPEARRAALGHATRREAFEQLGCYFKKRAEEACYHSYVLFNGKKALKRFIGAGFGGRTVKANRSLLIKAADQVCPENGFLKHNGLAMRSAIGAYVQASDKPAESGALQMWSHLAQNWEALGLDPAILPAGTGLKRSVIDQKFGTTAFADIWTEVEDNEKERQTLWQGGCRAVKDIVARINGTPLGADVKGSTLAPRA